MEGQVEGGGQEKKKLYKLWVKSQTHDNYVNYRLATRKSKRVAKDGKDASLKAYRKELSKLCIVSPWEFSRSARAMQLWDEPYNPTSVINIQDGMYVWYEDDKIRQRWVGYFRELFNHVGESNSHTQFNPRYPEHTGGRSLQSLEFQPKEQTHWSQWDPYRSHHSMWQDWYQMADHYLPESMEEQHVDWR